MNKSPVSNLSKPFNLDPNTVETNIFINLGKAARGRQHLVLLHETSADYSGIKILEDTAKKYSAECSQYLIETQGNRVIGSFFEINAKKLHFSANKIYIIDSLLTEKVSVDDTSFGGVLVFSDGDSFLILPENPNTNQYVVL